MGLIATLSVLGMACCVGYDPMRSVLPDEDEIVRGVRLTKGGKVVSERLVG